MSFFSVPNILIATGFNYTDMIYAKSEIINVLNDELTCSDFEDYPNVVEGAVGASLESTPVICGGYSVYGELTDKCYAYIDGKWQEFSTMTEGRAYAAAIVYHESLHIFGGVGQYGELSGSSEIVHADGTVTFGVDLPGTLAFHAITFVNETVSILTGGNQGSKYLHTT